MSIGAYQLAEVGLIVWTRKMPQFPAVRVLSMKELKLATASPSTAAWQGRLNGSVLLLGAMVPLPTPRLMKKRDMPGASQPVSPNGLAAVQTPFWPKWPVM